MDEKMIMPEIESPVAEEVVVPKKKNKSNKPKTESKKEIALESSDELIDKSIEETQEIKEEVNEVITDNKLDIQEEAIEAPKEEVKPAKKMGKLIMKGKVTYSIQDENGYCYTIKGHCDGNIGDFVEY